MNNGAKNKLTNHITLVKYKNWTFTGDSTNEILAKMSCLSKALIGPEDFELIFGIKKQAINLRINRWKKKYPEQFSLIQKEISTEAEFIKLFTIEGLTLFEIAHKWNCSPSYVFKLKRAILPNATNTHIVRLDQRQKRLCRLLFGVMYNPGKKFIEFIKSEIESEDVLSYYISGENHSESYSRSIYLQRLSKTFLLKYNIPDLIKEEVICKSLTLH